MIVFLDPGHHRDDAPMNQEGSTGRGGKTDCEVPGSYTSNGFKEHTFNWDTVLRVRQALTRLGVRTAMSRGNDDQTGPCVDERAAMANSLQPNAVVSIHINSAPASDRGFYVTYSSPPLNSAQAGPSVQFARIMRDQLIAAGLPASAYFGNDGLDPRSDNAGLNLAAYPSIQVDLGNTDNPVDASLIESETGRQEYANALVTGVVAFLQTQPPRAK